MNLKRNIIQNETDISEIPNETKNWKENAVSPIIEFLVYDFVYKTKH